MTKKTAMLYTTDGKGGIRQPSYQGDAGFDLITSEETRIEPGVLGMVPCGVRVALPEGLSSFIFTRSSSLVRGLQVIPTLIDNGYRGDIFVYVRNLTDKIVHIKPGERVAQLVPFVGCAEYVQLVKVDDLPESERGGKGFGSSGE